MPMCLRWFTLPILSLATIVSLACSSGGAAPEATTLEPASAPLTTTSEPAEDREAANAGETFTEASPKAPHPAASGVVTIDGIPVPALYGAIMQGDEEMVDLLVSAGADVNEEIPDLPDLGSPLSLAVGIRTDRDHHPWPSQIKIVEILVRAGADVHYTDAEGDTPLVQAVYSGQSEMVRVLVEGSADVNVETRFHGSLLNAALTTLDDVSPSDQAAIVELLVDAGADVTWTDNGTPVLRSGIRSGNAEIVRLLVNAGADPTLARMTCAAFARGSEEENWAIVRLLVEAGADPCGQVLLSRAIEAGNESALRFLMNAGADPADAVHAAYQVGSPETVLILVDEGVNPNSGFPGTTAVAMAINQGANAELVRSLARAGADLETELGKAVIRERAETVRVLVAAGADVEGVDRDGYTPLTGASWEGNAEIVRILLSAGADVNAADHFGDTPLDVAEHQGYSEIVLILTEAGALPSGPNIVGEGSPPETTDPVTPSDAVESLADAIRSGDVAAMKNLVNADVDVNARASNGNSLLEWAIIWGSVRRNPELVRILVDAGADVNARANAADSLLQLAVMHGNADIVEILEAAGAGQSPATSKEGGSQPMPTATPVASAFDEDLYRAIRLGETATVRALVNVGAQVDGKDSSGRSMLEWAITRGGIQGFPEIVQVLVDAGADVNAAAIGANSLLQLATAYGNSEVIRILTEAGAGK